MCLGKPKGFRNSMMLRLADFLRRANKLSYTVGFLLPFILQHCPIPPRYDISLLLSRLCDWPRPDSSLILVHYSSTNDLLAILVMTSQQLVEEFPGDAIGRGMRLSVKTQPITETTIPTSVTSSMRCSALFF